MARSYKPAAPNPEFDLWYAEYPRKESRGDARKAWDQTEEIRPPVNQMIEKLRLQAVSAKWREDGGQYIPLPATYLRAEKWDDVLKIELPKPVRVMDRYELANIEQARKDAEWKARQALQKAAA
jgi:hypothetical protein